MDSAHPQTWLTIGVAAEVAGVARRTAFRWAERGAVPVVRVAGRRLVEVGCLRAVAGVSRRTRASGTVQAISLETGPSYPSPGDADVVAMLNDVVLGIQETLESLNCRIARLERHLRLEE